MTTTVTVVEPPDLTGKRRALVLTEDRVGHYPEFRAYFVRVFNLDQLGLARPGYVVAPSGGVYEMVFVGRSGEAFPSGVEINALIDTLEPMDENAVDRDLWAILRWMIAGVGAPWSVEDLDATGRLYRLPATQP
jgi:hypothetical protein